MMLSIFVVLFAVMFLIAKIVDTIISSSDVYGWITKCQRGNETLLFAEDNITSSTMTLISTISFWWSGGMVILFALCAGCSLCFYFIYKRRIKSRHSNTDSSKKTWDDPPNISKLILKVLFEFSVLASIPGPISSINLWLKYCTAGYIAVSISLFFHSMAIIVTMAVAELFFLHKTQSCFWKCKHTILITIVTLFKESRIAACSLTFAVFFSAIMENKALKYIYLYFAISASVSVLIANAINRWKFYSLIVKKKYKKRRSKFLKHLMHFVTRIATMSFFILSVLTVILYWSNKGRLLIIITLGFLGVSLVITSLYPCFYRQFYRIFDHNPKESDKKKLNNKHVTSFS